MLSKPVSERWSSARGCCISGAAPASDGGWTADKGVTGGMDSVVGLNRELLPGWVLPEATDVRIRPGWAEGRRLVIAPIAASPLLDGADGLRTLFERPWMPSKSVL